MACRGDLLAATDDRGRVLLLDAARLTVLRVWKSYRRSQLSWLAHAALDQPVGAPCKTTTLSKLQGEGAVLASCT